MIYVLAPNNVIQKYPYSLTDMIYDNPQTSFPAIVTDQIAAEFNVFPVTETPQPDYNPLTQNVVWQNPAFINGVWVQQWAVENAPADEVARREAAAKSDNKATAESLLQATDWTQQPDVTDPSITPYLTNKDAFTSYRSALRAIAVNPPVTVEEWPVKPEEVWTTV
jgi:hypothetical protein